MIRTRPVPQCPLCQHAGELRNADLNDRLFDAPGKWNLRECSNQDCRLLWLDPAPVTEDIPLAYRKYYTHTGNTNQKAQLNRTAWSGYRAMVFGAERYPATLREKILGLAFFFLPNRKAAVEYPIRQLHDLPNGRALEIGCGSGGLLQDVVGMGWQAVGIDFDAAAVTAAREKGLDVHVGDLASQSFADQSFDAVLMNHVIEHLPDPVATLKEIKRIMRPRGRLLCVTPNSRSWGSRRFANNWRGLEPPRHIQIFTRDSLRHAAKQAGISRAIVHVTVRSSIQILKESLLLESPQTDTAKVSVRIYLELIWLWEWALTKMGKDAGEELLLVAEL